MLAADRFSRRTVPVERFLSNGSCRTVPVERFPSNGSRRTVPVERHEKCGFTTLLVSIAPLRNTGNGTTSLFPALEVTTGTVVGVCMDKHRHEERLKVLRMIERSVAREKEIHIICDNYAKNKHAKGKQRPGPSRWRGHFSLRKCLRPEPGPIGREECLPHLIPALRSA
jgi:hypothetical protein